MSLPMSSFSHQCRAFLRLARLCAALAVVVPVLLAPPAWAQGAPVRKQDDAIWIDLRALLREQPALLKTQLAALTPRDDGKANAYVIAVAGWSSENVFVKEMDGALIAIGKVLPIRGRIVRLVNNASTVSTFPLASPDNFSAAVRAVGDVMNKQEDILILVMTSHGMPSGFALLFGSAYAELQPKDVAAAFHRAGIRNRVVIVSACYSGIFVKPLADDHTVVLTAADSKSPSFGCGAGRDWTYFGDALFAKSLEPGIGLKPAFEHAKTLVRGWEKKERLQPSNPQGHFGAALMRKLSALDGSGTSRD